MSFVRYRQRVPLSAFQHLSGHAPGRPVDHPAAEAPAQWMPSIDVREEAARFVILADLPGIDPQQIEIQMDKGVLTIQGERKADEAVEGGRFSRIERRHGGFRRSFALPDSADADGISAHGSNGVLEVVIPKKPDLAPRRIQVGQAQAAGTTAH